VALGILVICAVIRFTAVNAFSFRTSTGYSVPVAVFVPLVIACLITITAHSPFALAEQLSPRNMPAARLATVGGLLALASAGVAISTAPLSGPIGAPAGVRNLVLLTGVGLCAVPLIGGLRAVALPIGLASVLITVFAGRTYAPPAGNALLQANTQPLSWYLAIAAIVVGLAAVTIFTRTRSLTWPDSDQ
jgi:hypothetical protein